MYAIEITGDAGELSWTRVDDPAPPHGGVVVRVAATAVNRADLLQRRGLYPPPHGASHILGLEAAGTVDELGDEAPPELLGKRVCCLLAGGGYAERVAVPVDHLVPIPDHMTFAQAAATPEVFYTAYVNLFEEGELTPGEVVVVHAGASGVGTAAIQLAKAFGCRVVATASAAKLDRCRELGADLALDRASDDFEAALRQFTGGHGADVILDPVGAAYLAGNVAMLAPRGRLVVIGLLGGTRAELDLGRLLRLRLRVVGSVLRSRSNAEKAEITGRFLKRIWPWLADRTVRPVVDRVMPITDVEAAHELLRRNETVGKVVLTLPTD